MIFHHLPAGPLMVNCFILADEASREALVIDPGGNVPEIAAILQKENLELKNIVNTHGHWDHTGGNDELKKAAGGSILIHEAEDYQGFSPDGHLAEGDVVRVGFHELKVFETPGHSPGGISLYLAEGQSVFVGDLLFAGSIGRTDLGGGSYDTLINSVRSKIFTLDDDTTVFPGHGPQTTVGKEKRFNPFF